MFSAIGRISILNSRKSFIIGSILTDYMKFLVWAKIHMWESRRERYEGFYEVAKEWADQN